MQTTPSLARFWCSFTRFGNSFMQGGHDVDQASSTTIFPLWAATFFSVSSQSTISTVTFGFSSAPAADFASDFFASFSSAGSLTCRPTAAARIATTERCNRDFVMFQLLGTSPLNGSLLPVLDFVSFVYFVVTCKGRRDHEIHEKRETQQAR